MIPPSVARLAYLVAIGNGAAAALTLLVPDVLNGPAFPNGNARGTAFVMLLLATPLLAASIRVARGSGPRAVLLVLGALAYFAYNDVMLLFATPFNRLFLVYTTAFAVTIFTSIAALRGLDYRRVAAALPPIPARIIATYVWLIVGFNTLAWLGGIVPAISGPQPPPFLDDLGVATNPVYVQDLSFWLPGAAIAAWLLWNRRPTGIVLVGAWLVWGVIEPIGVATDQWFGMQADGSVDATPAIVLFAILAVVGLVPALAYFRGPVVRRGATLGVTAR